MVRDVSAYEVMETRGNTIDVVHMSWTERVRGLTSLTTACRGGGPTPSKPGGARQGSAQKGAAKATPSKAGAALSAGDAAPTAPAACDRASRAC